MKEKFENHVRGKINTAYSEGTHNKPLIILLGSLDCVSVYGITFEEAESHLDSLVKRGRIKDWDMKVKDRVILYL